MGTFRLRHCNEYGKAERYNRIPHRKGTLIGLHNDKGWAGRFRAGHPRVDKFLGHVPAVPLRDETKLLELVFSGADA